MGSKHSVHNKPGGDSCEKISDKKWYSIRGKIQLKKPCKPFCLLHQTRNHPCINISKIVKVS